MKPIEPEIIYDPPVRLRMHPALPLLGCLTIGAAFAMMCLLPFFLAEVMTSALERLHLTPSVAVLAMIGIVLGSFINLPVHRIEREEDQPVLVVGAFHVGSFSPQFARVRRETIVAINVGGCVIPSLLAAWEGFHLLGTDRHTLLLAFVVSASNIYFCYRVARPVAGIGIMMPGMLSPLIAVGLTWLLGVDVGHRAPVAFISGIAGPLIGADLLHLKDITKTSMGMLSIGGAGTFDGIVLSGIIAALLA